MQDSLLQIPCQITGVKTMSHRSLRIQIDTQEGLTDEEFSKVSANFEKTGWFTFSVEPVTPDSLINLPPLTYEKDEKSPGQRLRASLFRLWEAKGKPTETFNEYYATQMERMINNVQKAIE